MPIRPSSLASLSSLFSASSMSVFPISLFPNFPEQRSINCNEFVKWILTYSAFFNILRCDPKDRNHLNHYLDNYIHYLRVRLHFCVDLDTSKEHFHSLQDVDKSVVTCSNILSRLMNPCVTTTHAKRLRIHTERRTPTPAKMMLAGEKFCQIYKRGQRADIG